MIDILTESLYSKQHKQFEKIKVHTKSFAANYCGNVIIRDSVFAVISNYARRRDLSLEILQYPFFDDELWAFTFAKKGTLFLCVNADLPLCKQNFAAAHELYHIYCYAEDMNTETIDRVSVLDSKTVDERAMTQEDLEANAFAGLLLMPDSLLEEQLAIYGIQKEKIAIDEMLVMMELFAIPYKAVVLRLMECGSITKQKARILLSTDAEEIQKRSRLLGRAYQWQQRNDQAFFGTLDENLEFNTREGYLTEERAQSDRRQLDHIRKQLQHHK